MIRRAFFMPHLLPPPACRYTGVSEHDHRELEITLMVGAHPAEAVPFQESHGGSVSDERVGVQRPDPFALQEPTQGRRANGPSPETLPEPVPDEAPIVTPSGHEAAGDLIAGLAAGHDDLDVIGGAPVRHEGLPIAR
jgi:hypothetical protein